MFAFYRLFLLLCNRSVPRVNDGDNRPSVVINMRKLDTMFPIDNGKRVVCLAGAGIATLSESISEWGFTDRGANDSLIFLCVILFL